MSKRKAEENKVKKNDFYIMLSVILIASVWWAVWHFIVADDGMEIIVTQNGKEIGSYPLFEDNSLTFGSEEEGRNVLVIRDGEAYMSEADCPDKLCVKQKAVSKSGESIICLPHRLVIEVRGKEKGEVDAIVR